MNGLAHHEVAPVLETTDKGVSDLPLVKENDPALGKRVKELRDRKQLSMAALAHQTRLSEDTLMKIESGSDSPSIYTLQNLARALQVPLVDFFEKEDLITPAIFTPHDQRNETICCKAVIQNLSGGYRNSTIEPFCITMPPDSTSGGRNLTHHGCEFVFILTGKIKYYVNDIEYIMETGDSLLFSAERPHRWENNQAEPSQILLILTSDQALAEQRKGHFIHAD
jgi:transcriptional regulator with XRE-family HTH domain